MLDHLRTLSNSISEHGRRNKGNDVGNQGSWTPSKIISIAGLDANGLTMEADFRERVVRLQWTWSCSTDDIKKTGPHSADFAICFAYVGQRTRMQMPSLTIRLEQVIVRSFRTHRKSAIRTRTHHRIHGESVVSLLRFVYQCAARADFGCRRRFSRSLRPPDKPQAQVIS